jgi:drug/metabolite transporter (DMT)-like permease
VLAAFDSSETTLFYSNLVGFVVTSIALPFVWTAPGGPLIILLMIGMGAFSGVGHYLLIIAHRLAPAAVVAPFIYTEIVWMVGLGYVVFNDKPNEWTLAGAAVVIASGLYLLYRERKVREET